MFGTMHLSLYADHSIHLVLCLLCFCGCLKYWSTLPPSFSSYSRYLSGGLPGEKPPIATASTQSRERLAAVKQALRALGFNKQVLIQMKDAAHKNGTKGYRLNLNLVHILTSQRAKVRLI